MKNRNKKSKIWNQIEKWTVSVWAANGCCRACVTAVTEQRPGATELWALPGLGLSCGVSHDATEAVGWQGNQGWRLPAEPCFPTPQSHTCLLTCWFPAMAWSILTDTFSRSWVVPGKPCQRSLISMCGLGGLGEAGGRVILSSSKTLGGVFCSPGSS